MPLWKPEKVQEMSYRKRLRITSSVISAIIFLCTCSAYAGSSKTEIDTQVRTRVNIIIASYREGLMSKSEAQDKIEAALDDLETTQHQKVTPKARTFRSTQ